VNCRLQKLNSLSHIPGTVPLWCRFEVPCVEGNIAVRYGSRLYLQRRDRLLSIEYVTPLFLITTSTFTSASSNADSQICSNSLKTTVADRCGSSSAALLFLPPPPPPLVVSNLTPFSLYFLLSLYPYRRSKRDGRSVRGSFLRLRLDTHARTHTHNRIFSPSWCRGVGRLDWDSNSLFGYSSVMSFGI
jgi:hypothetical protein